MTLDALSALETSADWLFDIGAGTSLQPIDGLVRVDTYDSSASPEEVAILEKAASYGARYVFFEAGRHGRNSVPQAFIFVADNVIDDSAFADIHRRLWSWGGVPLLYRASPGRIDLFRCAHEPDFAKDSETPICRPVRTLSLGAKIATADAWWDAARLRNGSLWDDPATCRLMLSADGSAHRMLVETVRQLSEELADKRLLTPSLRRRLLILALLIAYLEERDILEPDYFGLFLSGSTRFFEVFSDGPALVALLQALEMRFNGNVFTLSPAESKALSESAQLAPYARLVEGYADRRGQLSLWRLYSFKDLPIELISNIYQLFVTDTASSVYTPPALVRTILEETLSWERIDRLVAAHEVILDPACGSGVFLVEAYKRLVLHWRSRNCWARPGIEELRGLLAHVHGIDVEQGAVELAAFSLSLALCDALEPEEIRSSVRLFSPLAGTTLHQSCFFEAKEQGLVAAKIGVVVGNPPFSSSLSTAGARRSYQNYKKAHGLLADKQLAYLFLHEAMEMLVHEGVLAIIEPAGFLYNLHSFPFRRTFFSRWKTREILDFVSVRGMFRKGDADPKVVVVVAQATTPSVDESLLHAVFRRSGRAAAEQGFDIDYYDLHWLRNSQARNSRDVWRSNLLGGGRVLSFIERMRHFPTLRDHAERRGWDFGEGYIAGLKGTPRPASHLVGKPLLPTQALTEAGIDRHMIDRVPDQPIKDVKTERRFTPPMLLIKEHENLHHDLWSDHYLTFKNEIVGLAAPRTDLEELRRLTTWLGDEQTALRAYAASVSTRLFTQRATSIFSSDVLALPCPEDGDLELSANERLLVKDIVEYQRDFIRLGSNSPLMRIAPDEALVAFDQTLLGQINTVYGANPLQMVSPQHWPGAICRAYAFGKGQVDWHDAGELRDKLDGLLHERRGASLTVTRVARLYDEQFIFLLKPDRHRFWTRSVALRDADDVLADLRRQGF